ASTAIRCARNCASSTSSPAGVGSERGPKMSSVDLKKRPDAFDGLPSKKAGFARGIVARVAATSIERKIAAVLMAVGGACAVATCYAFFRRWDSQAEASLITSYLLYTDVAITLALAAIVVHRLFLLGLSSRRGQTGAKLHIRLVTLFAL